MRRIRFVSKILLAIALSAPLAAQEKASAGKAAPKRSPFDPGAPVHVIRPRSFHAVHYRLEIAFDEAAQQIRGEETLTFEPLVDGLDRLELDSSGLEITSVTDEAGSPLRFETPPDELVVHLRRSGPRGERSRIRIRYHGHPLRGLHFVRGAPGDPAKPPEIWSQGEQEDSHYWFPCLDGPDERATTELIGTVRAGQTLVANGALVSVAEDARRGTRTFHWRMDRPHPVYLTSVAVGPFAEYRQIWRGRPVVTYVPSSVGREEALRSFGSAPEVLEFFSTRTGVEYPYPKYSQTALQEFTGGMENISATSMSDQLLHDAQAERDYPSDDLVAHEAAHQWFGDMVTCRSWGEVWLNEGLADFFAMLWTERRLGGEEYRMALHAARERYLKEDAEEYRRPLVEDRYDDTNDLFDRVCYEKGSWVIAMLREVLGDEAFFRGIHLYLEENAWKSVSTRDLEKAFERAGGRDLDWFFDEWAAHAGHPEFRVRASYDSASRLERVTVDQVQKPDLDTPVFTMPAVIDGELPGGRFVEQRVTLSGAHQELSFAADAAPVLVRFDPGDHILKTLEFEKPREELLFQVRHDPDAMGRIWAAEQLGKPGSPEDNVGELRTVLTEDPSRGVREAAARALGAFKAPAAREALIAGLSDAEARVRAAAEDALGGRSGDGDALRALEKALLGDSSYRSQAHAAQAIGKLRCPESLQILQRALEGAGEASVVAGIFEGLGELGDARAIPLAVESAAEDRPEPTRVAALRCLGRLGGGGDPSFVALASALAEANLRIAEAAAAALGDSADPRAAEELRRAQNRTPMLRETAQEALKTIWEAKKEEAAAAAASPASPAPN